jgi:hypothetical protein
MKNKNGFSISPEELCHALKIHPSGIYSIP